MGPPRTSHLAGVGENLKYLGTPQPHLGIGIPISSKSVRLGAVQIITLPIILPFNFGQTTIFQSLIGLFRAYGGGGASYKLPSAPWKMGRIKINSL